jgi:poly-gamma-glutamate capsule biosynthesis protein CapA/YwtB (metallophosphatase superfamily)
MLEAGPEAVFGTLVGSIRSADLTLGNLESAATLRTAGADKTFTFRFPPEALDPLAKAGFDCLMVSNNHAFDFGMAGFLDTLDACAARGLGSPGGGRDEGAARAPWLAGIPGRASVRVWACADYPVENSGFDGRKFKAGPLAPGIAWLDDDFVSGLREAAGTDGAARIDIVMVHGGTEWSRVPGLERVRRYRELVEAGADMVIGSHPHVVQGVEWYEGRPIFYSLGNFVFPSMDGTPGGEDSVMVKAEFVGGIPAYLELVPVKLSGRTVSEVPGGEISRMAALSAGLARAGPEVR